MNQRISTILGLAATEQKILQSISDEAKDISEIARLSAIPRTSLAYILRNLHKRTLVTFQSKKRGGLWKSNLAATIRDIQYSHSGVVIYRGINEILAIFDELISLPKNTRWYGIQPDKSLKRVLQKIFLKDFLKINTKIKEKALILEGVVDEKSVSTIIAELGKKRADELFKSFVGRLAIYTRIPDELADVESEIYLFNETVYLVNWNQEIGIGIKDKDIVDLLMAMFLRIKNTSRYDQLEKMKEVYTVKS